MKHYEASATIQASTSAVWNILTSGEALCAANTGITRIDGSITEGAKFKLTTKYVPGRAFAITVSKLEAEQSMVWESGMPLGLFKGVRTFTLATSSDGVQLTTREEFTGTMLPLIWKSMPDLQPSFDQFVQGVKDAAESA